MVSKNGQYGLTQVGGWVGVLCAIGQVLMGDGSRYTHAFLVVDEAKGIAVEARPGGARYVNYRQLYERNPKKTVAYSHIKFPPGRAAAVVAAAHTLIGRPYNWLDYAALILLHWGLRPAWITERVEDKGYLICSQLVDEAERLGGEHLFAGRLSRRSQDVTPGALTYVGDVY